MIRSPRFLTLILALAVAPFALSESSQTYLPLQQAGQASIIIDDSKHILYIVDLGKSGDGDRVLVEGKPLVEWLGDRQFSRLVVTCSHPHADHMGGIVALFKNKDVFVKNGNLRFGAVTVIDNGMVNSLIPTLAATKASLPVELRAGFQPEHRSATFSNAFKGISAPGDSIFIENIPYTPAANASPNGRPVVTRVVIDGKQVNLDLDDAESPVIASVIETLKKRPDGRIDSFIVPHHGSGAHDVEPILELKPKQAIFTVNPHNQYGHPDPDILLKLMDELGGENVLFTGSNGGVRLEAAGVALRTFTAADPDSYVLFVRPTLERAIANKKLTKAKAESFRTLYKRMVTDAHPWESHLEIGKAPQIANDDPAVAFWRDLIETDGSILGPEFAVGSIPTGGVQSVAIDSTRSARQKAAAPLIVKVNASQPAARSAQAGQELILRGGPIADTEAVTVMATSKGGIPDLSIASQTTTAAKVKAAALRGPGKGGMVELRGDRLVASGGASVLFGGVLDSCATGLCVKTAAGVTYSVPFAASELFREVWERVVDQNVDTFYLSINPTKEYLQSPEKFQVPTGQLKFGTAANGPPTPANRVVTNGHIDGSQIGKILWEADVAFKSTALGFDVLKGGGFPQQAATLHSLTDRLPSSESDTLTPQRDRWCRLYWSSGSQTLTVDETTRRVTLTGGAVIARAEGMRLRNGALVDAPQSTWCEDMRQVASSLEARARARNPGDQTVNDLVRVAEAQNFVRWARDHGITESPGLKAKLSTFATTATTTPTWTSGIESKQQGMIETEVVPRRGENSEGELTIHYSGSIDDHDNSCMDDNFPKPENLIAAGCRRTGDHWEKCETYARTWFTETPAKVQKCTGARVVGTIEPSALSKAADAVLKTNTDEKYAWGYEIHPTAVQIHGGVALGANRAFLDSAFSEGRLTEPKGNVIFQNVDGDLHFWSFSATAGQHVVITGGRAKASYARDGKLRVVVETAPGGAVRNELRASPAERLPEGVEFLEVLDGDEGSLLLSKASWQCGDGCVSVVDAKFDDLGDYLDPLADESPGLMLKSLGSDTWVVQIDLGHVADQIRDGIEDDETAAVGARLYAQWGFEDEALGLYEIISKDIEGETQDTVFARALGLNGMSGGLGELIGDNVSDQLKVFASQVANNEIGVSAALTKAKQLDRVIAQLPPDVAADLWDEQASNLDKWIPKALPAAKDSFRKAQAGYTDSGRLAHALADELPNPWE